MTKRAKVLIVDDEAYIREIIAFDLQRAGYDVIEAENGKAALGLVQSQAPDVVVSDVRMPLASGVDLLRWIKDLNPLAPPLIFMTAFSDISADEALDEGAEAFLTKPLVKDDLLIEVGKALVRGPVRWSAALDGVANRLALGGEALVGGPMPRIALGSGGAFIEMDQDLPESLEIVAFDLPLATGGAVVLSGIGRVRWVRHEAEGALPAGVGVEFLFLEDASRRHYMEYLAAKKPRAYVPLGPA